MYVVPDTLATPAQLADWRGKPSPDDAVQILRSCTTLVLDASASGVYAVDAETGIATDIGTAKALREAVLIQASAWIKLGIDPSSGGVIEQGVKASKALATAKITYADSDAAAAARTAATSGLVPEALKKLTIAGLITSRASYR